MSRQMKARNGYCHLYEFWPTELNDRCDCSKTQWEICLNREWGETTGSQPYYLMCWFDFFLLLFWRNDLFFNLAKLYSPKTSIFTFKLVSQDWRQNRKFHFLKAIILDVGKYDTFFKKIFMNTPNVVKILNAQNPHVHGFLLPQVTTLTRH